MPMKYKSDYNKETTTDPVAIQHEEELKFKMGLQEKEKEKNDNS